MINNESLKTHQVSIHSNLNLLNHFFTFLNVNLNFYINSLFTIHKHNQHISIYSQQFPKIIHIPNQP